MDGTALIAGASRGLGRALAEELTERGMEVIATTRGDGEGLRVARHEQVDVTVEADVARLHEALEGVTLDLLFVVAGVSGSVQTPISAVTTEAFDAVMLTNALAPLRLIETMLDRVAEDGTIAVMSSDLGSIGRHAAGRMWETYRMSKAAMNMGLCNLADRLGHERRTFLSVAPGWVRTDMGGSNAPLSIEQSIVPMAGMLEQRRRSGGVTFVNFRNETVPW